MVTDTHEAEISSFSNFTPSHTVYLSTCSVQFTLILAFCFAFVQITCVHLFCVHGPPLTQIAPHASPLPLPPSFLTAASSFPRSHPPSERVSSVPVALQPQSPLSVSFLSSRNISLPDTLGFVYLSGLLFTFFFFFFFLRRIIACL